MTPVAEPPADDLRLVPTAAAAWGTMWVATSGSLLAAGALAGCGVVAGIIAWWRRSWVLLAVVLVLAATLGLGLARHTDRHSGIVADQAAVGGSATVVGEITGDPRPGRGAYSSARVMVHEVTTDRTWRVRKPVVLIVSGDAAPSLVGMPVGTRIRADVRWTTPEPGDDITAVARTRRLEKVADPGFALRQVERVREGLRTAMAGAPPARRALVPALVLGDISAMTDDLRESFVRTGLTHLTAVSGANLTYLLVFLTIGARLLGVRGRWLQVVGVIGVAIFVALCRTEPSVLRAAAMGLVTVAALTVVGTPPRGAPRRGVRHLCLAVLVLVLIDPWLSRSIGFVLSVAASGGIIGLAGRWTTVLGGWLPKPVAEAIAVPLAAQIATQPVVTAVSGEISLVGLVANAVAGPAVGPATVLGFAAAGASLIHPLPAAVLGWAAGWCAQLVIWVAGIGGQLPGAAIAFPTAGWGLIWLVALMVLLVPATGWILRHPPAVIAVAIAMVLIVVRGATPPGWPPPEWTMVACDVGQGDAIVLPAAAGQVVLVDTGPEPAALRSCLTELGVERIPLLVLTHYHDDHIGGLAALADIPVEMVLVSPLASPPGAAADVRARFGDRVREAVPGERIQIGALSWTTLGPTDIPATVGTTDGESSAENDASVSAVAEVGGTRILLTGDLAESGQRRLAATGAGADVLKVPHHGSADFSPALLENTGSRIAVIGVGEDNTYGHPAPSLLRALHRTGHTVIARTDEHGSVALVRRDHHLSVISRNPTKGTS